MADRRSVLSAAAPPQPRRLSVALDGAGSHPAAWRESRARPAELLTAAYVGIVTPRDARRAAEIVGEIRAAQDAAGRAGDLVHVFGDLEVFLGPDAGAAARRKARLDELAGTASESDAEGSTLGEHLGLAPLPVVPPASRAAS